MQQTTVFYGLSSCLAFELGRRPRRVIRRRVKEPAQKQDGRDQKEAQNAQERPIDPPVRLCSIFPDQCFFAVYGYDLF